MSDWQSPRVEKPPQGRKILWFKKGELFVSQRFGDKYVVLSHLGGVVIEEPTLWMLAPIPEPYTGYMLFKVKDTGEEITADELEERFPDDHKIFVDHIQCVRFEDECK